MDILKRLWKLTTSDPAERQERSRDNPPLELRVDDTTLTFESAGVYPRIDLIYRACEDGELYVLTGHPAELRPEWVDLELADSPHPPYYLGLKGIYVAEVYIRKNATRLTEKDVHHKGDIDISVPEDSG